MSEGDSPVEGRRNLLLHKYPQKIAEGKHSKMSGKACWTFPGRACFAASLSLSSEQISKAAPTPTAAGDPFHLKKEALTIESSHLPYKALQGESILLWTYIVVPSNDIPKFPERDWSPLTALQIVNKTGKKKWEKIVFEMKDILDIFTVS